MKTINYSHNKGFTLLEVLLAVFITALIGMGASQLLSGVITTKQATESRAFNFRILQRADQWMKRDIWQVAGREIHNELGSSSPALSNQTDFILELTRSGLASHPFSENPKPNLQRIAIDLQPIDSEDCQLAEKSNEADQSNETYYCLLRLSWSALDNVEGAEPNKQILIDEVLEAKFQFRGQIIDPNSPENSLRSNDWQDSWPPLYLPPNGIADLAQVKLLLTLPRLGELERIYEVPRYAFQE